MPPPDDAPSLALPAVPPTPAPVVDTPVRTRVRGSGRMAAWLAFAAVAVALAATPHLRFELDRFYLPKELILHVAAYAGAGYVLRRHRVLPFARADALLAGVLVLGVVSALAAASPWMALRALSLTVSAAVVFWTARALAHDGHGRLVVAVVTAALALSAGVALAQAYGVRSDLFSLNRAPGGTMGNRNTVAHLSAIGVAMAIFGAAGARRWSGTLAYAATMGVFAAALLLTRSRAAWLAVPVSFAVVAVLAWLRRRQGGDAREGLSRRLVVVAALGALGLGVAFALPNGLRWASDTPYRDSVRTLVDASGGSGEGRMRQYRNTLRLVADHPFLGVGPGHWPSAYPTVAPAGDPSLTRGRTTANPWPSSDLVAVVAERGIPAAILLAAFGLTLLVTTAVRAVRAPDRPTAAASLARVGVLVTAVVCGAFDAVLLLAAPALLVAAALGALSPVPASGSLDTVPDPARRRATRVVRWIGLAFVVMAVGRVAAITLADPLDASPARLRVATLLDPGSYRLQLRLADRLARQGRCDDAVGPAEAAHRMLPEATEPRRILRRCGAWDAVRR